MKRTGTLANATLAGLLVVLSLLVGSTTALAGAPARNAYSAITDSGATLQPDATPQAIGTTGVTLTSGGLPVTTFTITILGTSTVGAGEVTAVDISDGTNTWSASGSYGPGSAVTCTGPSATPVDASTMTIRVTLAPASAGKTVGIEVTSENGGNQTGLPAAGTLHNIYAPADTLSVTASTPVASSGSPGNTDVQMQYLQVDSNNAGNGNIEITTVTVDDLGTAGAGDIDNLKIHIDDDNNFGNGVLDTIITAGWNGTSTPVDITAMTAGTRTVSFGTSKYIWITYDLNAGIIDGTQLQSSVTGIAVAGGDIGASGTWNSNNFATSSGPSNSLADCAGCHEYPPVDSASRDSAAGTFVGDHDKHAAYTCATCHVAPATETSIDFAHRSGTLNMDQGNIGVGVDNGTYSKGTGFAQSNAPVTGTCSAVDCHSNNVTPQWGVGTTTCSSCHALPPNTNAHSAHYTAKGWAADSTNCTVCHPDNTVGHSDVTDSSVTVNAGLTYNSVTGSCSAPGGLGCHNDTATPNWSGGTATCTSCHTAGGVNVADPSTGLHAPTNLLGHDDSFDTDKTCTSCHTATPSNAHTDGTLNNGGTATFNYNATYIPAGYDRTNDYCAATCHTDGGTWNREWSGATDATWAYANDAATTAVCGNCHGSFFTGWNIVGATSHDNPDIDNDPDTLATSKGSHTECSTCHAWGHTNYSTGTKHINNTLEMNSTLDSTPGDGNCTTNCHGGLTLTFADANSGWTDASVAGDGVTCGGCHTGGVTPGAASGAHDAHGATAASVAANPASIALCIECHGNDGTGASHNNGTVDFVGATYSTAVRNDLTGTCSTTSCHNTGAEQSATWNAAALACNDCHYYEASPTAANNSAHDAPLSATHGDHFTGGKTCTQCHGALPTDTTHINGATSNADKATALQDEAGIDFTHASAVTDYTFADAGNTCGSATNNGLGCHATGSPDWDVAFASTACTNCHTDTSTAAVNPTSGLHGVVPSVSGQQHNDSVSGGCAACHVSIPVAGTHKDGTFAGDAMGSLGLQYYTQTAANTGTCATTTCHLGNSDAWAHKWMTPANYTSATASCTGCHGNLSSGWNAGVDHLTGEIATDHADDGTASNYGCEACHALQASTNNYPFTFGTADWAPLNAGNKHGNNLITMNDDGGGTISNWQRGTGGNSAKSMCLKCHTNWTDSAPQHWFTNTSWTPEEVIGDGISAGHGVGAACISCHDGLTQGSRRDVGLEFNLSMQHGSNNPASADCEKCHDESSGPDTVINLKVWDAAGTGFTTVTYNPADLAAVNTHCISCHDTTRNVTVGGLSPPARSMVNFTSTQTYNNHNFTGTTGAVVPQKAKAISPHGNPGGNQLKATESSVSTAMGCLHCHPSHGSGTASKSATADATGAAVSARMLGGLPSSAAGVGYDYTSEGSLSDPALCWGCHDAKGVADYYGDTLTGHWDGGTWKSPTFAYKTGKGGVVVKHIASKVDGGQADDTAANIVCTTCHDVHGSPTVAQFYSPALKGKWLTSPYYEDRAPPSKASTTNGLYSYPNAGSTARSTNDQYSPRAEVLSGTGWAPKEVGGGYGVVGSQNGAWGYFIDANTFGMSAYQPYTTGAVTQRYMSTYDATAANINTFAGLCMTACHSAANIEARTAWTGHNPVVPGFGGGDAATDLFNVNGTTYPAGVSRNQMVGQGWYNNTDWGQNLFASGNYGERQGGDNGAFDAREYSHNKAASWGVNPTAAGAQANYHQFPCSKCHNPHASELPALMRTNCLNTAKSAFEWRMAAEANNCHRVEDAGAAYQGAGDPYNGTTNGKQWNTVTPW